MTRRRSNNPKRRIADESRLDIAARGVMAATLTYHGSALHKRHPSDYNFTPPVNPRPWKSLCDGKRIIPRDEAQELLRQGIIHGLVSDFPDGEVPKYVWSVDRDGVAYEAKRDTRGYHGYRLEEDDDFRFLVLREWRRR